MINKLKKLQIHAIVAILTGYYRVAIEDLKKILQLGNDNDT